eukprot:COSAG06_NODE_47121_length_341_cov_1.185950_1_plen_34_part_10
MTFFPPEAQTKDDDQELNVYHLTYMYIYVSARRA